MATGKSAITVYNLDRVMKAFDRRKTSADKDFGGTGSIGYTAPHALPVHERVDIFHPVGNAKYLERPWRENRPKVTKLIELRLQQGFTLRQAMLEALSIIFDESQAQVPVDTGALKASGFMKVD